MLSDATLGIGLAMWFVWYVLSSIAEIVPETAPEAWMVQEAKDALGVNHVE